MRKEETFLLGFVLGLLLNFIILGFIVKDLETRYYNQGYEDAQVEVCVIDKSPDQLKAEINTLKLITEGYDR